MSKRIYVGNLPWAYTATHLQELFGPYGSIISAEVISDRVTGRSRGFGFVQLDSDQATESAIAALNGKDVNGRPLTVNEAKDRAPRGRG